MDGTGTPGLSFSLNQSQDFGFGTASCYIAVLKGLLLHFFSFFDMVITKLYTIFLV
jgi:hypothetical protein